MAIREEKITLEPMDIFWGRRQKDSITFQDDTASSEAQTYFTIGLTSFFWLDDGIVAAPVPGGAFVNAYPITYSPGDSAAVIAALAETAVDAVAGMNARSTGAVMEYEADAPGAQTGLVDGDTGYTIANLAVGDGRDLGGSGDIDVTFSVDLTDVLASQAGTQILDQVMTASNMDLSFELLELTKENWDLILGEVIGDKITVDATELVGLGESKRFKNLSQYARELRLKPVGAVDDSRNLNIWKVYPIIDTANYSGSDLSKMSLSWKALRDTSKDTKINLMTFGDGTKNLLT